MFTTSLLPFVLPLVMGLPHPHYTKNVSVNGAGGKISVTYFTVPYNAETLKKWEGTDFHMGRARISTEVAIKCGGTELEAGDYNLQVRRNDKGEFHKALIRKGREGEPMEIDIADAKGEDAEHLEVSIVNHGFPVDRQREPISGAMMTLQFGFGPLHKKLKIEEVLAKKDGDK